MPRKKTVNAMLKFCHEELKASKLETVFGIEIYQNLNFEDHIKIVCSKTAKKLNIQKQPHRGVLSKRCSENMQQIYRRTPMPKCNFNKVAKAWFPLGDK